MRVALISMFLYNLSSITVNNKDILPCSLQKYVDGLKFVYFYRANTFSYTKQGGIWNTKIITTY